MMEFYNVLNAHYMVMQYFFMKIIQNNQHFMKN